jgi:hypothetical protein
MTLSSTIVFVHDPAAILGQSRPLVTGRKPDSCSNSAYSMDSGGFPCGRRTCAAFHRSQFVRLADYRGFQAIAFWFTDS